MRACLIAVAAVIGTAPAYAAPVYLQCLIVDEAGLGATNLTLTLSEESATAGFHVKESGHSEQGIAATFTPEAVRWLTRVENSIFLLHSVNRMTSEYAQVLSDGKDAIYTRKGKCTTATSTRPKS